MNGRPLQRNQSLAASGTKSIAHLIAEAAGRAGNPERRSATCAESGFLLVVRITIWTAHHAPGIRPALRRYATVTCTGVARSIYLDPIKLQRIVPERSLGQLGAEHALGQVDVGRL